METTRRGAPTIAHRHRPIQAWRRLRRLAPVLLTLPMMIAVPVSPDSSSTRLGVSGSTGEFLYVGLLECNSEPLEELHHFDDVAAHAEHRWKNGAVVRASLGRFSNHVTSGPHGALAIGYDRRMVRLTAGAVASPNSFDVQGDFLGDPTAPLVLPTFSLRLGPADDVYFTAGFMDDPLVYSPRGYAHVGVGLGRGPLTAWVGVSSEGPWLAQGLAAALEAHPRPGVRVGWAGRLGHTHDVPEWGMSLSLEVEPGALRH